MMKKLIFGLMIACLSSLPAAESSVNLLKNPGFEKVTAEGKAADWTSYGKGYELREDNIQDDGKYNVMFTGEEATVGISQPIYGKATGEYNISLDFLLTSFNEGQMIPIYLIIITSDKQRKYVSLITFTPDKIKPSQEWQKLTASVDLKKYSATGTFMVWCLATKFTGKFYIDNFKVEEVK